VVIQEFLSQRLTSPDYPYLPDKNLFLKILQGGQAHKEIIQYHLSQCLKEGWSSERLDPVLVAILTAAITELISQDSSVSAPVIISEYVDLTKGFFQGQEPAYVNKVLDQLARTLNLSLKKSDSDIKPR
jgi:N utilization substance protein B